MDHAFDLVISAGSGVQLIMDLEGGMRATAISLALAHARIDHALVLVFAAKFGWLACRTVIEITASNETQPARACMHSFDIVSGSNRRARRDRPPVMLAFVYTS